MFLSIPDNFVELLDKGFEEADTGFYVQFDDLLHPHQNDDLTALTARLCACGNILVLSHNSHIRIYFCKF